MAIRKFSERNRKAEDFFVWLFSSIPYLQNFRFFGLVPDFKNFPRTATFRFKRYLHYSRYTSLLGHSVRQIFPNEEAANLLSVVVHEEEESSSSIVVIPPKILDENKFDIPIYCARIILTKLKFLLALQTTVENSEILSSEDEIIDLLYDLTFAFVRNYASDFLFLQQFIEDEIVPKISLSLRRATFFKVINLLKSDPKNGHSMHLVRFMQYIVAPSFSFAFDNYEIDLVVGGVPSTQTSDSPTMMDDDQKQQQQNNIVLILCREVIQKATSDRTSLSHTLVIVMYLFCSLFVQKCSTHIYDASKKQQGNKQELGNLRPFMLFGWPSLQQSFRGDLTEKYAGLFLIANIVDKFLINRTIILQVLNSLIQAYQQDNKEMVRKSLDILIPAVTRRMTDGYSQLKALIKKVMIEETKQYGLQIIHCLQIIIRQYKVFYYVRHSMSQLILSSIQKLMSIQIGLETKRLLLEFCEVVIKWEQDRQQQLNLSSNNSNCKIEHVVVELGDDNDDNVAQQQPSTSSNIDNEPSIPLPSDSNKEMDKNFIDTVIMFLFRMATSTDQFSTSSGGGSSALEQINRRALLLLRLALKPNIFGNVVTIRTNLFEKQLQLPNPEQFSTANETAINQQLQLVNITLDVLSNIIPHLSQQLLIDLFRPLQRSLICCMSYSNSQQILRSTYNILGKLLDKTTKNNASVTSTPPPGLNDFDLLNQHISRCIHDAFNNYACSLTASPPMTVITLLRLMHSAQSNYLETVCLGSFVKLLQRLVREYVATNFTYSATTAITPIQQHDLQAQKLIGDLLSICLELLCSRTRYFNIEAQKTIVQFVIIPLIEKGAADKIIENVIKIATEILTSEVQLISESFQQQLQQITSTPQQNIKIQSLGAQVLFKLFSTLESRLTTNFELKNLFLNAIILLYENSSSLMLSGSGDGLLNIEIIQPAFYWGLCCVDKELRKRFFTIHQRLFPPNLFARLIYIFTNERWDLLNSSTTNSSSSSSIIAHLINLLLNSDKSTTNNSNLLLKLKNCSIFCPLLIINEEKNEEKNEEEIEGRKGEEEEKIIEKMSLDVETIDLVNVGDEEEDEIQMDTTTTMEDDKKGRRKDKEGEDEETIMEVDDKEDNKTKLNKIFDEIQESLCISNDEQSSTSTFCTEWIENFVDLLYIDPLLCQQTFIELFTSIWSNLNENEREQICSFITPFLTSSAFYLPTSTTKNGEKIKKEDNFEEEKEENFVVSTILKALIKCKKPEIEIDPVVLSYVGSNFKCWHIALLKLEKIALSKKALISNIGGEITTSAWNAAANLTEEKMVIQCAS
uniref:HEAT repeat-containing protein 1 n=1 Tax=Meloidogyne incognita TaxID=6306 RepID=A0A914MSD7_MELIC